MVDHPLELLQRVRDWGAYVRAIEDCHDWWRLRGCWSVLGDKTSWRNTVEVLHELIKHPEWSDLDQQDQRRLLGLSRSVGWQLLGKMRAPARGTVFYDERETIENTIREVVAADDDAFPDIGFKSYETLEDLDGVGQGIATRLLTLARPDRFVSVNTRSQFGLGAVYGLAPSTIGDPRNYARLLRAIYNEDWWQVSPPTNRHELRIYRMRAALLDSFVYDAK